jgi:signal transduction histidine kinase
MLNDLPTLLGMLRMRFNDQLEAAGIDLHWAVTELPEISNMSPRRSLHIMRIVQEAMTNAVKHSGTERIKLSTGIDKQADRVFIEVTDFGGGDANFDTESNSGGRGIKNMQYRAQQVAGDLQLINTPSGVTVRLLLDVA